MTQKTVHKSNAEFKNATSFEFKIVFLRDTKLFKYTLMQHKTKSSSKASFKLCNDISTEKLHQNTIIDSSECRNTKTTQETNYVVQSDHLTSLSSQMTPSGSMKPGLIEENLGILAQVRASCCEEELNFLFRKMLLNFRSSRDESSFFIKDGIFSGAYFKIKKDGNKLNLNIKNAQKKAAYLLTANKIILKERLAHHQIELVSFNFY